MPTVTFTHLYAGVTLSVLGTFQRQNMAFVFDGNPCATSVLIVLIRLWRLSSPLGAERFPTWRRLQRQNGC